MLWWFLSRPRLFGVFFLPWLCTVREKRRYSYAGLDVSPGSSGRRGMTISTQLWHVLGRISHWGSYINRKKSGKISGKYLYTKTTVSVSEWVSEWVSVCVCVCVRACVHVCVRACKLTSRYSFSEERSCSEPSKGGGWCSLKGGGERDVRIESCGGTQWLSELASWTSGCGHCGLSTVELLTLHIHVRCDHNNYVYNHDTLYDMHHFSLMATS